MINEFFVLGPHSDVINFDTSEIMTASMIMRETQRRESEAAPLGYYSDPLYVMPCAVIVYDTTTGKHRIEFEYTPNNSLIVESVLWEASGSNEVFATNPHNLYNAKTEKRKVY